MTRIHIFCEGQTERAFAEELLLPHFQPMGIHLNPILLKTGPQGKGGIATYGKVRRQILHKCKEDRGAWVTTLIDLYGLPGDFPGIAKHAGGDPMARAKALLQAFQEDISERNFLANLMVHEFEGLLFADPKAFGPRFQQPGLVQSLLDIRGGFATPEHINSGPDSAPSKRILGICDSYKKTSHGPQIALAIGLTAIRGECALFGEWLGRVEALAA